MCLGEVIMKDKTQSIHTPGLEQGLEKPTLVVGASLKRERYSNRAIRMLRENNVPVFALGLREGEVEDVPILKDRAYFLGKRIHTVTLYMNRYRQEEYYNYIISLKPERVIFNPGTENHVFSEMLEKEGIEAIEACTLVMLTLDRY